MSKRRTEQTITVVTEDNKITVVGYTKKNHLRMTGTAVCHHDDKYDFFTGFEIAYKRMRASERKVQHEYKIKQLMKNLGIEKGTIVEVSNNGKLWMEALLIDVEDEHTFVAVPTDICLADMPEEVLERYADNFTYCRALKKEAHIDVQTTWQTTWQSTNRWDLYRITGSRYWITGK